MDAFLVQQPSGAGGGGGGSVFLQQTFTGTPGTALTSLAPAIGSTWGIQNGYSPATPPALDAAGTALYATVANDIYVNAAVPPAADYHVEAVFSCLSLIGGDTLGVMLRAQSGAANYYTVRFSGGSWGLAPVIAGNIGSVQNIMDPGFGAGVSRTVRLTAVGSTITASVGGIGTAQITDAQITAAGSAGLRLSSASTPTTGIHVTSIIAST